MKISSLKPGDLVEVDKKGRRFFALFRGRLPAGAALAGGDLKIKPLDKRFAYQAATSHELVGIWHANKQTAERYGRVAASG